MGAHEVKEIPVFVICTKSKQIFVLKQYLVLTLHCLHAPLYSQIHSDTLTLITHIHTPTCRQTASNSLFQRILSVQSGSMRFSRASLYPSLHLSISLSLFLCCLSIAGSRKSCLSIFDVYLLQRRGIMKNMSFINKTNNRNTRSRRDTSLPLAAPIATACQLMRFCRAQRG